MKRNLNNILIIEFEVDLSAKARHLVQNIVRLTLAYSKLQKYHCTSVFKVKGRQCLSMLLVLFAGRLTPTLTLERSRRRFMGALKPRKDDPPEKKKKVNEELSIMSTLQTLYIPKDPSTTRCMIAPDPNIRQSSEG